MPEIKPPFPVTHDAMFAAGFKHPEVLSAVLKAIFAPEVVELFAGPPELLSSRFLDGQLKGRIADLLFRIPLTTGPEDYAYVPLEHKSRSERLAALQVAGYALAILNDYGPEAGQAVPWVLPVLVHCGERRWTAPLSLAGLIKGDHAIARLARRWLRGPVCSLLDLAELPLDTLEAVPLAWAVCATLRGAMRPAEREALLPGIIRRLPDELLIERQAVGYILAVWKIDRAELEAVMSTVKPTRAASLLEEAGTDLIGYGEAIGRAEGRAEGQAEGQAEGEAKGKAEMLTKQMRRRFGPAAEAVLPRIAAAGIDELDRWSEAIFDAPSPEAVLAT